ncbi:MAG: amino acid ABC transporter permease [Chloroflexi bacterium]|nr:amino acid ABC transporter permease [Chloroflexota bacterium]
MDVARLFEYRYWKAFLDVEIWVFLLTGLQITLTMAAAAIVLSLVFGTLLALARLSRVPLVHYPAVLYIEIIRALPVLLLIFFMFFGGARGFTLFGLRVSWEDPVVAAILALTVYTSAVNAEIVRAGILSIERGQVEAARALGLSYVQTMRLVVLPQALRRMVPPQVSQLITLIKDTSLAFVIGAHELLNRAKILYSGFETGPIQALFVAAVIYFAVNYALSLASRRLELPGTEDMRRDIAAEAGIIAPTPARP